MATEEMSVIMRELNAWGIPHAEQRGYLRLSLPLTEQDVQTINQILQHKNVSIGTKMLIREELARIQDVMKRNK